MRWDDITDGVSSRHSRNFSAMSNLKYLDKDAIYTEEETNEKNLKTIIEFEKKLQNRVRYLAQED